MRRLAAAMIAAASTACHAAPAPESAPVTVHRLPSFAAGSDRTRFGALTFLGGIQVESRQRGIGGLSGIDILADGVTAFLVSDNGYLVTARLDHENGQLAGLSDVRVAPIHPGTERSHPKFDAEDIVIGPDGRHGYISAEWSARPVIAFTLEDGELTGLEPLAIPRADLDIIESNQGIESVAIFPANAAKHAGEPLAIAEHPGPGQSDIEGWIGLDAPIFIERSGGYDVSSARFLPDGDLVLLERRFGPAWGVGMRLRRIPAAEIEAGARLSGEVLMEAGLGHQIDNMEGLAVNRGADGRTILTLVSDDNTSLLQRTLILQFALDE